MDLWIYQEILWEVRPDLILETGTFVGGSALYFASLLDSFGIDGQVLTVDIERCEQRPSHSRITYVLGSSVSPDVVSTVRTATAQASRVLVILDSDHSCEHVLAELRLYAPLVTSGSYVIVEDSNLNGHPVACNFGPGPYEAITKYLQENSNFEIDRERERLMMTQSPAGYLRRK